MQAAPVLLGVTDGMTVDGQDIATGWRGALDALMRDQSSTAPLVDEQASEGLHRVALRA